MTAKLTILSQNLMTMEVAEFQPSFSNSRVRLNKCRSFDRHLFFNLKGTKMSYVDFKTSEGVMAETCRVARFGLFEAKNDKFGLFYIDWPRNFFEFIKYLTFFKVYRSLYSKIRTFFRFLKQSWAFFNYKHLATLETCICISCSKSSSESIFLAISYQTRSIRSANTFLRIKKSKTAPPPTTGPTRRRRTTRGPGGRPPSS